MEIYTEYITPAELTGYSRTALADRPENQFVLSRRLPDDTIGDLVYRLSRGGGGLAEAAAFRSYDAEPRFGRREGIARVTGELPPIGQQYLLGEYDSLRLRNAGEEIRNLFLRDGARAARSIDARLEFARGQALVEGKVSLAEDGLKIEVDFGRKASHTVAPGVLWSDTTNANALDDFEAWADTYADTNGQRPVVAQMSTRILRLMRRNKQVRDELLPVGSTRDRVRLADLNDHLAEENLPRIEINDERAIDVTGVSRRIIADDKVVFLPEDGVQLGKTLWGVTAESQEPEYGIEAGHGPGLVVGVFKQKATPIRTYTIGAAIALPVLADPDLSMCADVA